VVAMPSELTVGQLAQRSGVAVSALHFYERLGLITSRRTAGNQRRYARPMLRRVAMIRLAVRLGIPLAVVADALSRLPADRTPRRRDWVRPSTSSRAHLRLRVLAEEIEDSNIHGAGGIAAERKVLPAG
jgi:MerR family transcriptional regulator, redox-sensitive transcriptional activator SoxR